MQKFTEKRMSQKEAGAILHINTRQIKRFLKAYRQLIIAEGLWKPRKAKKVVTHQLRERRACFGGVDSDR